MQDFGARTGECPFRVGVCVGVHDEWLPSCIPTGADRFEFIKPENRLVFPEPAPVSENRRTLHAAAQGLHAAPAGTCTPFLDVRVPLASAGSPRPSQLRLVSRAVVAGATDVDRLRLVCLPAE